MTIRSERSTPPTHREDSSPAALCLDDAPLAVAMREAWQGMGLGPFPVWTPTSAQEWPHPDRAVRDTFHAQVNALLYGRLGIDPNAMPTDTIDALGEQDKEDLVERYRAGEPVRSLMTRYRIKEHAVFRLLARRGVPTDRLKAVTEAMVAEIVQLRRDEGMATAAIAARLSLHYGTVRKVLLKHGVTMGGPGFQGNARAATRRALVQQLHAEGKSDKKIAARLHVSTSRVMQLRQLLGLPANVNPVEKSERKRRAALAAHAKRRAAAREAAADAVRQEAA